MSNKASQLQNTRRQSHQYYLPHHGSFIQTNQHWKNQRIHQQQQVQTLGDRVVVARHMKSVKEGSLDLAQTSQQQYQVVQLPILTNSTQKRNSESKVSHTKNSFLKNPFMHQQRKGMPQSQQSQASSQNSRHISGRQSFRGGKVPANHYIDQKSLTNSFHNAYQNKTFINQEQMAGNKAFQYRQLPLDTGNDNTIKQSSTPSINRILPNRKSSFELEQHIPQGAISLQSTKKNVFTVLNNYSQQFKPQHELLNDIDDPRYQSQDHTIKQDDSSSDDHFSQTFDHVKTKLIAINSQQNMKLQLPTTPSQDSPLVQITHQDIADEIMLDKKHHNNNRIRFSFNRNIVGKITEAINISSMDRINLHLNEDESTTSTSRMTTPNQQQISSYKNFSVATPLSTHELINVDSAKLLEQKQIAQQQQQILNPEERIRELTGIDDIQVFDLCFILELLNKKYGLSYTFKDFNVSQRIEMRLPTQPTKQSKEQELQNKLWASSKSQCNINPPQSAPNQEVVIDRTLIKNHESSLQLSAKSWAIYDARKCVPLWSKSIDEQCEIASLTKIMTAYLTCRLIDEMNINPHKVFLRVSKVASTIGGTSAYVREGQRLSVYDLLVGLMLPSGNDAAMVLAEHFGRYLVLEGAKINYHSLRKVCELDPFSSTDCKIYIKQFVKRMNETAKSLKLNNTQFSNPHGLSDKANRSTASDISRLAFAALKNKTFRDIVEFKTYKTSQVFQLNLKNQESKLVDYTWYNSNKLLNNPGFKGVKTGYTQTAGSCLCTHYVNEEKGVNLLITLLCAKSNDHRFTEMAKLAYWAEQRLENENRRASTPATSQMHRPDYNLNI